MFYVAVRKCLRDSKRLTTEGAEPFVDGERDGERRRSSGNGDGQYGSINASPSAFLSYAVDGSWPYGELKAEQVQSIFRWLDEVAKAGGPLLCEGADAESAMSSEAFGSGQFVDDSLVSMPTTAYLNVSSDDLIHSPPHRSPRLSRASSNNASFGNVSDLSTPRWEDPKRRSGVRDPMT